MNANPALTLAISKLHPGAVLPDRAHPGDAGLDLRSVVALTLSAGQRASVPTGLAMVIPEGWAGLVLPRSGLAARHGVSVVNSPGLIDSGYRGEVKVLLLNTDRVSDCSIAVGDRIAQLVLTRVPVVEVLELDDLPESERGEGGFGSSGR